MDNLDKSINEIAEQIIQLNKLAYIQYKPIADDLCSRIATVDEVTFVLDRMLDFCGNDDVLRLFKKVCRHYINIYPDDIVFEIYAYRDMYDNEEGLQDERRCYRGY